MKTVSAQWFDDSVALSAALAELDWIAQDDLLTDGDLLGDGESPFGPALPDDQVLPIPEGPATRSPGDWSVQETLARVAAGPPGPQPIRWLTCLDGRQLSDGEALAVAGAWERQSRWVAARQQA